MPAPNPFAEAANILAALDIPPETLARAITRIDVKTAYGPPLTVADPFAPGPPNPYLQALKPEVTVWLGDQPVKMAPYGKPGPSKWPWIQGAAILGGVALGVWALNTLMKGR
jgi:hypothetical protein